MKFISLSCLQALGNLHLNRLCELHPVLLTPA